MRFKLPEGIGSFLDATVGKIKKPARWHGNSSADKRVTKCVARGRKRYNDRAYSAAIEEFRQALTVNPKHPRALYYIGNACYKTKDFQKARHYWGECICANPDTKFAGLSLKRLQHLDKQDRKGKGDLDDFYRQLGIR